MLTLLLFAVAVRPSQAAVGDLAFTIEAPLVQESNVTCPSGLGLETFNEIPVGDYASLDGSIGDYTDPNNAAPSIRIFAQAATGGARFPETGATRNFISTPSSYLLTLDQPAGYFGFWWSAGDGNNKVTVNMADGSSQVFTTQSILDSGAVVGAPGGGQNGHYGNPTGAQFGGQLDTELFAFVNIFATNPNAKIESLLFEQDQGSQGEFETDNHTVCADILNPDTGTPILQTGSITIVKEANPESEQEFDFLTNIGGPNSAFTLKDNGIDDNFIVFDDLPPFLYDVSELPPAGWVFDEVDCTGGADIRIVGADVQIALSGGEDVTCTYTNEAVFDLTIVKEAVGGDDTFEFEKTVNSDIDFADFSLTTQGGAAQTTLTDLPAGFLQIEEIVPPGWKLTDIDCVGVTDDDWASNFPRASLTASPGDDITCTFTNEKLGTINIVKQTAPANGVDFGFTDDIESPNNFSLDDGQTKTFLDVVPGQYTVTEDDPGVGTFLSGLVCDDANSATPSTVDLGAREATINLDPGETVTCTYTNTAEDFIVIAKLTEPAGGVGFDFTSPLGNFTLDDGEIEIFEIQQPARSHSQRKIRVRTMRFRGWNAPF